MDTTQIKEAINTLKGQMTTLDSEIAHLKIDLDIANNRRTNSRLVGWGSTAILLAGGPIGWAGLAGGVALSSRLTRKIRHLETDVAGKSKLREVADKHVTELREELTKASMEEQRKASEEKRKASEEQRKASIHA